MKTLTEFRSLIQIAIREEKKAQDLYGKMAEKAKDPFAKAILQGLQEEEEAHERKLQHLLETLKPTGV